MKNNESAKNEARNRINVARKQYWATEGTPEHDAAYAEFKAARAAYYSLYE